MNLCFHCLTPQAKEAQHCEWATVSLQFEPCVFQKSKAAEVIIAHQPPSSCVSLQLTIGLRSPRKASRKISKIPFKVLDAPELQDDFYLNLVNALIAKYVKSFSYFHIPYLLVKGWLEQSKCVERWTRSLCIPLVSLHKPGTTSAALMLSAIWRT